jgi:CRISPR-associated protein Cas6
MSTFWKEDKDENAPYVVPDDVVDLVYRIDCRALPLDHAHALSQAVRERLDWMDAEPDAGIHLVHGAESGNGWLRPEDAANELLHLSRRARMTLRVPRHRIDDARQLTGETLDIEGHALAVGEATVRLFSTMATQFARYVASPDGIDDEDETAFLNYVVAELGALDIKARKILCGRAHSFQLPDRALFCRSVMLADLEAEEAVRVQQRGIGDLQKYGCGLFIPHKGIKAVHQMARDKAGRA